MTHPLDNPAWRALTGPHSFLSLGEGLARHYPREMAPFSAIAEPTPEAYADLGRTVPEGGEVRLFRPSKEAEPEGWETFAAQPILQMVLRARLNPVAHGPVLRELHAGDYDAMLDLTTLTRPGPFSRRTGELGRYLGIFEGGSLVAMAGIRFSLVDYAEISAVCVHPDVRGRGYASAVIKALAEGIVSRGQVPFLHVFPENPALAAYEHLGFVVRTEMWVIGRRLKSR